MPALLTISYSLPSAEKPFDDFKAKSGRRMRLYGVRDFQFSATGNAIYWRYENPLVQLQNFGAEISDLAGGL